MSFYAPICSFFLFVSLPLTAQISISASDLLGLVGSSFMVEEDTSGNVTVDVGQPGNDQTWDLSNIQTPNSFTITREFLEPDQTPYSARFPDANLAEKITTADFPDGAIYNYLAVEDNRARNVGSATMATIMGTTFENFEEDNSLVAPLPINIGSFWSETIYDTTSQAGVFTSIFFDSTVLMADGWGTLILPSGQYTCLRFFEQCWTRSETIVGGISQGVNEESALSYIWVSPDQYILATITSQDGETDPNFTSASSFNRLTGGSTAVADANDISDRIELMGSNPFKDQLPFQIQTNQAESTQVNVIDLQGRLVRSLHSGKAGGPQYFSWNGQDQSGRQVTSGTYFLTIRSGNDLGVKQIQLIR